MRKGFAAAVFVGVSALVLARPARAAQGTSIQETARLVEDAARHVQQRDAMIVLMLGGISIAALMHWRGTRRISELESMSLTDPLTGVRNRRYLEQTIDLDVASSLRSYRNARATGDTARNADLVFLVIDLDTFKAINDKYGHQLGDRVLKAVADSLQRTCRDSDLLVRWGGDEFLVVERFADRADAVVGAERFRAAVEATKVTMPNGERLAITCSVGYASFPFMSADPDVLGWEQVVTLADLAAYSVKREGKNACSGYVSVSQRAPEHVPFGDLTELDSLLRQGHVRREIRVMPMPDNRPAPIWHENADGPHLRLN